MRQTIKIDYDGFFPNLCSGNLNVTIDDKTWDFGKYALISGGHICGGAHTDWDMWAEYGPWSIDEDAWPEGFPEDEYLRLNVLEAVNGQVSWGCCGGCI